MIEDIFKDLTTTNIVVGVFGLWVLWNLVTRIDEERRILSYGKHAPTIRVYLPYSKPPASPTAAHTLTLPAPNEGPYMMSSTNAPQAST